jgi:hypothetical protein
MMHICPVCGYDRLTDPPLNFSICPSCGTEFGYDDKFASHAELRAKWLLSGPKWWSPVDPCPDDWNPDFQVDPSPAVGPSGQGFDARNARHTGQPILIHESSD